MTNISDIDLIKKIKQDHCSDSLKELAARHEGIYYQTVKRFEPILLGVCGISKNDINNEFLILAWKAAYSFDFDKNVKYNTWLERITRYYYLDEIRKFTRIKNNKKYFVQKVQIPENFCDLHELEGNTLTYESDFGALIDINTINQKKNAFAKKRGEKVEKVFELVYNSSKRPSWKDIGSEVGMSGWGAILLFEREMKEFKKELTECNF